MTPLDVNLQHLIEAVDIDLPTGDPLSKVSEAQQRARSLSDIGDQLIDHFVTQARAAGAPWSQIGEALGVSKQAAQQRWVPPAFQMFTDRARHVIVLAQERARGLRHGFIGTEHLLLGVLDEPDGAAGQVLAQLAGSVEAVREAVLAAIEPGAENSPAKIPFNQAGKEAIGQANAQSVALGHNYVGTEHILLGLLKVSEGTAARVLGEMGIDYDRGHEGVIGWIAAYVASHSDAARRIQAASARAEAHGVRLDVAGEPTFEPPSESSSDD